MKCKLNIVSFLVSHQVSPAIYAKKNFFSTAKSAKVFRIIKPICYRKKSNH